MKIKILYFFVILSFICSCSNDKKISNSIAEYSSSIIDTRFYYGSKLQMPQHVKDNIETVSLSFGNETSSNLAITPEFFKYGANPITLNFKTKAGKLITHDVTVNVFTTIPEKYIGYKIVQEYPHNPENFLQGLIIEGNTIYESVGLLGVSKLIKYNLGSSNPTLQIDMPPNIFAEGCAIVGDKIYQLTYQNRIGFVYDKNTFKKILEFQLPNVMKEGWGITYNGNNLIVTDGTSKLFYLDPENPSEVIKTVEVVGHENIYDQLNELEFHKGYVYSNIWHKPIVLKINPTTGEVVGKFDFTSVASKYTNIDSEHVLNGIAFKGDKMLISGKNWCEIYEVNIN